MNREEAIQLLQEKIDDRPLFKDEREAFELAIEALSADVVSRDVYDKRTKADEEIIDSYREMLTKCHKEILRLLDFNDAIERQNDVIEVVLCKDCRHADECHKSVQYTRNEPRTVTMGYAPIEFCSHGERREK